MARVKRARTSAPSPDAASDPCALRQARVTEFDFRSAKRAATTASAGAPASAKTRETAAAAGTGKENHAPRDDNCRGQCAPQRRQAAPSSREEAAERLSVSLAPAAAPGVARPDVASPPTGRVLEFERLSALCQGWIDTRASGAAYVSGVPGSGKTYVMERILRAHFPQRRANASQPMRIDVNCASLADVRHLYAVLVERLGAVAEAGAAAAAATHAMPATALRDRLRRALDALQQPVAIVLDEIDLLASSPTSLMLMYATFELPRHCPRNCVVIGVANALDLPERLLPWLHAARCMPEIVAFAPYRAEALRDIAYERLGMLAGGRADEAEEAEEEERANATTAAKQSETPSASALLSQHAVELAARKVAAGSGDARAFLDVCREAVLAGGTLPAMVKLLSARGGASAAVDTIRSLPLQQQVVLCAILLCARSPWLSAPRGGSTAASVHARMARVCRSARIATMPFPTLYEICSTSLMHHGLIDMHEATVAGSARRRGRGRGSETARDVRIGLRVSADDVRHALGECKFFGELLLGGA